VQRQNFTELAWLTFLFSVGLAHFFVEVVLSEFPVGVSRLRNGHFASEMAVRRFQKRNRNLDPEVVYNSRWNF
jgi:hypothetical protein